MVFDLQILGSQKIIRLCVKFDAVSIPCFQKVVAINLSI